MVFWIDYVERDLKLNETMAFLEECDGKKREREKVINGMGFLYVLFFTSFRGTR
jgi:hypothetical protein